MFTKNKIKIMKKLLMAIVLNSLVFFANGQEYSINGQYVHFDKEGKVDLSLDIRNETELIWNNPKIENLNLFYLEQTGYGTYKLKGTEIEISISYYLLDEPDRILWMVCIEDIGCFKKGGYPPYKYTTPKAIKNVGLGNYKE